MATPTRNRRLRRQFDEEFKAGAVRLVLDEGTTVGRVARDLALTESALRIWVERARADRTTGRTGLTTEEREELRRLRKENRELRTEREILKKAAAFFAKHLAAMLDLFSRFTVGWAVSAVNDRHLTSQALQMALKRRCPEAGLLHHSDQGCTHASEDYQAILHAHGITCSMSRTGNCHDTAVMESFFSTVKHELGEHFESCGGAKMALFEYLEVFYNQRRRHSTLGQISPAAFERRAVAAGVDAVVPVDAKNAPTRDLEHCTDRSFPQRPHPLLLSWKAEGTTNTQTA